MDSVTLLYDKKEQIGLAISFDYGSNHNEREIECARYHCELLGIDHTVISLAFMGEHLSSSLLEGAEKIPEGDYKQDNMKSTVVPFRNGVMLSVACAIAENGDFGQVLLANHAGNHALYPDCTPEFVRAMDNAMQAGTYRKVRLNAPYTHLSKSDIAVIGKGLNIDYSKTYSCYKGGERQCGKCGTCIERKEALATAGIKDETEYEE